MASLVMLLTIAAMATVSNGVGLGKLQPKGAFVCPKDWNSHAVQGYVDTTDARKYWMCTAQGVVSHTCPEAHKFNPHTRRCEKYVPVRPTEKLVHSF